MSGLTFHDPNFKLHTRGGLFVNFQPTRLTSSGPIRYNGFESDDGAWVILERHIANGTIKYATGTSDFLTSWTGKAGLTYVEYVDLF